MALVTLPRDGKDNVFVFGSNIRGIHGAGAARFAYDQCGAEMGVGFGRTGNAFALPTKDVMVRTLPLYRIREYVAAFLEIARLTPATTYYLTPVGCGLAGYKPSDIAPLFEGAPDNVVMPEEFK